MKKLLFVLAVVVPLLIAGSVRGDDPPAAGGSATPRFNLGSTLPDIGRLNSTATDNPFSRGLGQTVSGWTHDGIHGTELADRIHWLQQQRRDGNALTSFRDRDDVWRRDGDGRWSRERDIREDRREIRDDLNRLRDDERRVARDREELRRDLADVRRDRNPDERARDYRELREDRQRLMDDEQRVARDRQELRNDRDDLRRDLNRDRDDRFRDRDRDDRFRDRDRDDHRHDFAKHEDRGRHGGPGGQHERDAYGWQVRDQHGWRDRTDHRGDHSPGNRDVGQVAHANKGGKGAKGADFAKNLGPLGGSKNDHGVGFGRDFGNFGKNILPNNQRPLPANLPFGGGLKPGKGGKGGKG